MKRSNNHVGTAGKPPTEAEQRAAVALPAQGESPCCGGRCRWCDVWQSPPPKSSRSRCSVDGAMPRRTDERTAHVTDARWAMSSALYNEIEPFADVIAVQGRLASTSCDRAMHGKSGIAPRPSPAICSSLMTSMRRDEDTPGDAQRRARGPHGTIRMHEEHWGSYDRTASGCRPATVWTLLARDRSRLAAVSVDETFAPTSPGSRADIHRNTTTCSPGRVESKTSLHTCGIRVRSRYREKHYDVAISICTSTNNIVDGCASRAVRLCTQYSAAGAA